VPRRASTCTHRHCRCTRKDLPPFCKRGQAAEANFLLAKGGTTIYSRVAVGKRKVALWM
jgi:hypothetical protein